MLAGVFHRHQVVDFIHHAQNLRRCDVHHTLIHLAQPQSFHRIFLPLGAVNDAPYLSDLYLVQLTHHASGLEGGTAFLFLIIH